MACCCRDVSDFTFSDTDSNREDQDGDLTYCYTTVVKDPLSNALGGSSMRTYADASGERTTEITLLQATLLLIWLKASC